MGRHVRWIEWKQHMDALVIWNGDDNEAAAFDQASGMLEKSPGVGNMFDYLKESQQIDTSVAFRSGNFFKRFGNSAMPVAGADFCGLCIQFQGKCLQAQCPRLIEKRSFAAADVQHRPGPFSAAKIECESEFWPVTDIIICLFQLFIKSSATRE